jgi:ankyrin repeat protein
MIQIDIPVGFRSVTGGIQEPGVNHGVSPVVNHAGILVGNQRNTVGFYHGKEGFRHGFSGRIPAGYRQLHAGLLNHAGFIFIGQLSERDMREAFEKTPRNLNSAFESTIQRIKNQPREPKSRQAMLVLKWVFLAKRQLKVEELCHALTVRYGDKTLDSKVLPSEKVLLDGCLGLVTVGEETSCLRLVHKSLQDYFEEQYKLGLLFDGQNEITKSCLAYMNLQFDSETNAMNYTALHRHFAFLDYAVKSWGLHARDSPTAETEVYWNEVAAMLHHKNRISYGLYPWIDKRFYTRSKYVHLTWPEFIEDMQLAPVSPAYLLFIFAYFGVFGQCIHHYIKNADAEAINAQMQTWQYSALYLATDNCQETFVSRLLENPNLDVNIKAVSGRTPLHCAVDNGYEILVRLPLEEPGIEINTIDQDGRTPLFSAVSSNNIALTRLLLARSDIDVQTVYLDRSHQKGFTPAASRPNVDVSQETVSDSEADNRLSALSCAAVFGHEDIVRILLERTDVGVNRADKYGRTPLSLAAEHGQVAVARLLLTRADIDVNRGALVDYGHVGDEEAYACTPLLIAIKKDREDVARLLLHTADVDVNTADKYGQTPLSYAASRNDTNLVGLLLDTANIDLNHCTPLVAAASNGASDVLDMLLQTSDIEVNQQDKNGDTAYQ